jgi:hypothetical protein
MGLRARERAGADPSLPPALTLIPNLHPPLALSPLRLPLQRREKDEEEE